MSTISIIKWANSLGITEAVNGSWIEAIARHYGDYGNKPHIQSIANSLGITEPVNGSWIQAIAEHNGVSEGPWLHNMMSDGGITPPPAGCADIQDLISSNYGNIGATRLYYMIYKLYNYNRTGWILLNQELGTDELQIRGIEFDYKKTNTSTISFDNQKLYLGHIQENAFPASVNIDLSNLTVSDLTLVWEGTATWNYASPKDTQTINFDNTFCYNGEDNIVILWVDDSGNYTFGSFYLVGNAGIYLGYGLSGDDAYLGFRFYQDAVPDDATDTGTRYNYRPNTKLLY